MVKYNTSILTTYFNLNRIEKWPNTYVITISISNNISAKRKEETKKGGPTLQNRQKTEKKGLDTFSKVLGNSSSLQFSSTCRCPSIKVMEVHIWWHSRNRQACKRTNLISKKKKKTTKKDWQAVSREYTCSGTFNSSINAIDHTV